jgi:hypothetical protein
MTNPAQQNPIELNVSPHSDNTMLYMACWNDGDVFLNGIDEIWIDLLPFLIARKLLSQGYDPARPLIVRLQGADYIFMQAPLGVVAATPLLNTAAPVTRSARCLYRRAG